MTHSLVKSLIPMAPMTLALWGEDMPVLVYWLMGLTLAAIAFNQVSQMWRRMTGGFAHEPEEDEARRPRLRKDCLAIHSAQNQRINDVEAGAANHDEALRREFRADCTGVHKRIDAMQQLFTAHTNRVLEAVGEVRGEVHSLRGRKA